MQSHSSNSLALVRTLTDSKLNISSIGVSFAFVVKLLVYVNVACDVCESYGSLNFLPSPRRYFSLAL